MLMRFWVFSAANYIAFSCRCQNYTISKFNFFCEITRRGSIFIHSSSNWNVRKGFQGKKKKLLVALDLIG